MSEVTLMYFVPTCANLLGVYTMYGVMSALEILTKAQDRSAQTPFADEEKEWAEQNNKELLGLQRWQLDQWDLTYGPTALFWVVDWRGPIPAVGSYNFDFLTLLGLLRFVGGGKQDDISVVVGVVMKIWTARSTKNRIRLQHFERCRAPQAVTQRDRNANERHRAVAWWRTPPPELA